VPHSVICTSERTLHDRDGKSLGRVDLLFEGRDDNVFVVVVENKLYAGFSSGQLARYQAALRIVRGHGGRGGLVALTRDVPTRGELRSGDDEWIGSIRWSRLLPRLRKMQVADTGVSAQWQLLLDVLDEQGDLGMTRIDADAVRAWSRYFEGREQLQWLLEQVFATVFDHAQKSLAKAHRVPASEAAALWYKPRARRVLIQHSQSEIQFGISVPASYTEQSLRVGFWMEDAGEVGFGVTIEPRVAVHLLADGDRDLLRRVETLVSGGLEQIGNRGRWYSSHPGSSVLDAADAPSALLTAVNEDISLIAKSKIFREDLTSTLPRNLRRATTKPWGD